MKVHSTQVVDELADGDISVSASAGKGSEGPAATAVGDIKEVLPGMGPMVTTAPAAKATSQGVANVVSMEAFRQQTVSPVAAVGEYSAPGGKVLATPATRKLARDLGVDLTRVRPSGPGGRVTKEDVRQYAARLQQGGAEATAAVSSATVVPAARAPVSIPPAPAVGGEVLEERVPFRGLRRKIAEKMQQSKNTAAHFTFVEECDCTALKALRERLKDKAAAEGVKLTYLPFIAKAVVAALKKHPLLNSALDEASGEIVIRKYYNLGIATATEQGLVVPVVKHVDRRSLLDIAREIERLSTAARSGKLVLEDLQGSTFTITSLGAQGGLFATPIINFPEVAILGVHQMKRKPVVRGEQIVIGDVMLLSLSFDHRVIDGHVGAAFAYDVIGYLEDPDRLMLEL
ncbi:Dihydrolipoyllysine-residue acetyltransferase component of pyruvate dehydrogenase complex [bacterium HR16]|nr:Dihydrolipoyllysine-residue acetyltransferase component of pyruvate dehydrogenase complex [bacterium HR16]